MRTRFAILLALIALPANASLEDDGVWKGGLWAPTVWADGVWREGAPADTGAGGQINTGLGLGFGL